MYVEKKLDKIKFFFFFSIAFAGEFSALTKWIGFFLGNRYDWGLVIVCAYLREMCNRRNVMMEIYRKIFFSFTLQIRAFGKFRYENSKVDQNVFGLSILTTSSLLELGENLLFAWKI